MAGIIIVPACFSYGVEVTSGPSLIFVTLPNVFTNMAGGRVWGSLFFLFMTFAVSAVAMLNNSFAKQWILMSAGGLLFAFSDAVLSTMYFKEGGNTKPNVIINHTLYYAAQFVIASSVLFIK